MKKKIATTEEQKKDKILNDMYNAVNEYIISRGGKTLVIGGVNIERTQYGSKYRWRICIDFLGNFPEDKS